MRISQTKFVCSLLIALSMRMSATTIVGVWTKKQVTIAADSKQTVYAQGAVGSQTGCKVFEVRHLVVALAGVAQAEAISVVDAMKNSRELHDQDTNAKLPIESVVIGAEAAITDILKKRHTTSGEVPIAVIIAGLIDGQLQMYRFGVSGMQLSGDYAIPQMSENIAYPRNRGYRGSDPNRGIEVIGIDDSIKRYKAILPDEWSYGRDVDLARRLVAIEAADSSASVYVGPPISTVVLTKKGIVWVNKGACE